MGGGKNWVVLNFSVNTPDWPAREEALGAGITNRRGLSKSKQVEHNISGNYQKNGTFEFSYKKCYTVAYHDYTKNRKKGHQSEQMYGRLASYFEFSLENDMLSRVKLSVLAP